MDQALQAVQAAFGMLGVIVAAVALVLAAVCVVAAVAAGLWSWLTDPLPEDETTPYTTPAAPGMKRRRVG